jgi:hypothetical protein
MKVVVFLLMSFLLTSCGGGGSAAGSALSELLVINSMYGTAAVGLPLKNADVKVKCRSSNLNEYQVSIQQGSPATFTIADAPFSVKNSVFTGQSLSFKVGGQLPNELGFYQKYYVVDVVYLSNGNSLIFKLAESPPNELTDGPALNIKATDPSKVYFVKTDQVVMETGKTDKDGIFKFANMQSLGSQGPCVLEASGTTGEADSPPLVLHSLAMNFTGRVNITPLTEALLASVADTGKLTSYFYAFDETSALRLKESASVENIQLAWEKIKSGLSGLNIDVSAINNSPITEPLYAANDNAAGNAYDQLLDAIRNRPLSNEALPYKELLGGKQNLITLIKLDSHGVALKNQFGKWSDSGNEKDGTQWDCVHDTANGIYWEVKRNDPSHYRHRGFKYTWFDSNTLNGGGAGTELNNSCQGLADTTKCNTENYVKAANIARLCGFDKWVLPDVESVKNFPLSNSSAVLANTEYFPDMQSGPLAGASIWTRLPSANNAEGKYAWTFNVASGVVEDGLKSIARPVRLMLPVKTLKLDGDVGSGGVVKVLYSTQDASDLTIANGLTVNLRTTGYLPTPLSDSETYFIVNYNVGQRSFNLARSVGGEPLALTAASKTLRVDGKNISMEGVIKFNSGDSDPGISNRDPVNLTIGTNPTTKTFFVTNSVKNYKPCPEFGWLDGIPPDPQGETSNPTPLWMTSATFSTNTIVNKWSTPEEISRGKGTLQFSKDGIANWHAIPKSDDGFMREGPLSNSIQIVGEQSVLGSTRKAVAFYRGVDTPPPRIGGDYMKPVPDVAVCFDPNNSRYQVADSAIGNPLNKATLTIAKGDHFVVIAKPRVEIPAPVAAMCNPAIEVTRNPTRYSVAAGEVTDSVTNLVWKQCVTGLSGPNCEIGNPDAKTFEQAKKAASESAGWRLPTRKELASLVERKCTGVWQYAEAASGLWMSTRLFTATGGWEQESNWSNPVAIDASTAFSTDGSNWHLKAQSIDVYMGQVISMPGQAIQVASKIRIAGESGYGWRDGIPPDPKDGDPTAVDSTPTPLWMTSATFSVDGLIAPWSAPVEITKGKGTLEFSTNGYTWHSSPLSSDIYMRDGPNKPSVIINGEVGGVTNSGATIQGVAFYRGNYGPELEPKGGTYSSPTPAFPLLTAKSKQGMVTGVAFYRGTLPPFNPIGGSFAYPTPSSPGWYDGIPKAFTTANVISAADSAQAINPTAFPQASRSPYPQAIWTSEQIPNMAAAWIVNFYNGFEGYGDTSEAASPPPKDPMPLTYVRLVKNK